MVDRPQGRPDELDSQDEVIQDLDAPREDADNVAGGMMAEKVSLSCAPNRVTSTLSCAP